MSEYINLIIAIIEQATKDYKNALRGKKSQRIKECERFFLSEWGQLLTHENGEHIIKRCRREVAEERRSDLNG